MCLYEYISMCAAISRSQLSVGISLFHTYTCLHTNKHGSLWSVVAVQFCRPKDQRNGPTCSRGPYINNVASIVVVQQALSPSKDIQTHPHICMWTLSVVKCRYIHLYVCVYLVLHICRIIAMFVLVFFLLFAFASPRLSDLSSSNSILCFLF